MSLVWVNALKCTPALWNSLSSRQEAIAGRGLIPPGLTKRKPSLDGLTSVDGRGIWRVQANGGSDHLKEGEGFFLIFFFFVCDFYQNTEIRHTHKPALKRSSIYSSAGTCPSGQLPAGGVGEEVSHVSRERK